MKVRTSGLSPVASATYTINPVLPPPVFSIPAGTYSSAQTVSISDSTSGATIYYTTNGTTPTTSSTKYSGAITVSTSEILQAIATETSYTNSSASSASYTITLPAIPPTYSLPSGTYTGAQTVSINDATPGATIYYTTNGTTPTNASQKYSGPITISASETIEAMAAASSCTNSTVASASYSIAVPAAAPAFSLTAGTYTGAQTLTISDSTPVSTIYYTTNGTTPTSSSTKYSGPIAVSASETVEALAVAAGYSNSSIASASYTITGTGTTNINFGTDGFSNSGLSLNYGATVTGGMLELTDGKPGEFRSAWSTSKVPINSFTTDFTFQLLSAVADGFTFTIQNDPKGIWALGNGGSGLGYQGIQKSVAVKFDIYNNAGEGSNSTGVFTNGAVPTVPSTDLSTTGVVLASGHLIHAHLVYNGSVLTVTLTDTKTGACVTEQYSVNIPSVVGASSAYVGFTGSAGAYSSVQEVTSWSFAH